jgi:hypothetical protein
VIDGEAAAIAGVYGYSFDTNQTGSVTAAAGSARIDRLDVQISDPAESDGSSTPGVAIVYTAGSPGSGVPAAAPARTHPFAQINVPASGGGSPSVTWTASYYAAAGGVVPFNLKSDLDAWTTATPNQEAVVLTTNYRYMNVAGSWRVTGSGKKPYFRYHKTGAFSWNTTSQTLNWDTIVDGALDGMTYASGVFTCVWPGLWEFDVRVGQGTGASSGNVRWFRNGTVDIAYDGASSSGFFSSQGGPYKRVLAAGDTVSVSIISGATISGVNADSSAQLTWLSAQYLGLY